MVYTCTRVRNNCVNHAIAQIFEVENNQFYQLKKQQPSIFKFRGIKPILCKGAYISSFGAMLWNNMPNVVKTERLTIGQFKNVLNSQIY